MGKRKLKLNIDNPELRRTLEYLLASSGFFDITNADEKEVFILTLNTEDVIGESFAGLLGTIMEKLDMGRPSIEKPACAFGLKTISLASLSQEIETAGFAVDMGHELFRKGYRPAYISLKPLNLGNIECVRNAMGFVRLAVDSQRGSFAQSEKYTFDDGEMVYIGAPIFNPNAGDMSFKNMTDCLETFSNAKVDYLIIDIGVHLDLERLKIFLSSAYPMLVTGESKASEEILHRHFEGALQLKFENNNYAAELMRVIEIIENEREESVG